MGFEFYNFWKNYLNYWTLYRLLFLVDLYDTTIKHVEICINILNIDIFDFQLNIFKYNWTVGIIILNFQFFWGFEK